MYTENIELEHKSMFNHYTGVIIFVVMLLMNLNDLLITMTTNFILL